MRAAADPRAQAARRASLGLLAAVVAATATAAAAPGPTPPAPRTDQRLCVFAGILPHAWFLERLGGDRVAIEVLVGPGQTPETFEPTPRQMAKLGEAAALLRAGVPFERSLLPRVRRAFPRLEIVDTLDGLPLRPWEEPATPQSDAGHAHGGADPHVWLDPLRARGIARNIAAALARLDPPHAPVYASRLATLDAELVALDEELAATLAPWRGRAFYVFHPAFGYLAERYGLRQVAIQAGGREPTPRELARVIDAARRDGTRVLFAQPQYAPRSARQAAASLDAQLVELDDLARDYDDNLRRVAAALARAFAGPDPEAAP